jgi:CSLREA domain-containing protein
MYAAVAAVLALLAFSGSAAAKTFRVNKTADHAVGPCTRSDCTLREAVVAANARTGLDTILLRGGRVYGLALAGAGENFAATGDLDVIDPVVIRPAKPRRGRRARRATIDGNDLDRVLHALASTSISRLVIRDGNASVAVEDGGGIGSDGAPVTIARSVLRENLATGEGGGVDIDDDTLPGGRLTIRRSVITANSAAGDGGGGVSADEVTTLVRRSTISANHSANVAGGLRQSGGTLEIAASTVSRNLADNTSGGIRFSGSAGVLTLTNVTIEGNRAESSGGGIRISSGTANLTAVTIVRNAGDADNDSPTSDGGGLQEDSDEPVTVKSSIIALNTIGMGTGPDCFSNTGLVSGGHNLRGSADPACTGFTGPGEIVSATPLLGALRNNGGPTKTACPKKGSPAINAGAPDAPARDQRGRKRVRRPDVGACEFVPRKKKRRR